MSAPRISYEIIQLRPNQLLLYTYVEQEYRTKKQQSYGLALGNTANAKYTGLLTPSAKNKLKLAINLLVAQSTWKEATNYDLNRTFKFRINFITLTLSAPQGDITDKEIKHRCLNTFLTRAKKLWGMDTYVWRAEKQKNTNIHFHITTDVYIHYRDLCRVWNECQELLGFVTRYRERNKNSNPNSTDVHAVKDIKNLAAYLVKYMSKGEKDAQVLDGKVWGCSHNLLKPKRYEIEAYGSAREHFARITSSHKERTFTTDYCTFVTLDEDTFLREIPEEWRTEYLNYLASVKNPDLIPQPFIRAEHPPSPRKAELTQRHAGCVPQLSGKESSQLLIPIESTLNRPSYGYRERKKINTS